MWHLAPIPFLIHALLMAADEGFHLRRGLGTWERWGHPIDTLTVLICYALAVMLPATAAGLAAYAAAAFFSCLCVTKDEWIHARTCSGPECWLHACLFLLHPILLAVAGLWGFADVLAGFGPADPEGVAMAGRDFFGAFLVVQAGLTVVFGAWQVVYWNGPWKPSPVPAKP
jgi:hypothetical protein